jgi:hypothetical protein
MSRSCVSRALFQWHQANRIPLKLELWTTYQPLFMSSRFDLCVTFSPSPSSSLTSQLIRRAADSLLESRALAECQHHSQASEGLAH